MAEKTTGANGSSGIGRVDESRRSLMKGAAIAGLAATLQPVLAESAAAQSPGDVQPLRDPRTRFMGAQR
jgi:hypothetical protein